ncbi:prolyl oligopeptidase family serine peptidase [bacterium]|nr:prolyl oligopeptidase family serine peptidase [bacterium]
MTQMPTAALLSLLAAVSAAHGERVSAPLPPECAMTMARIERAMPAVEASLARLPSNSLGRTHASAIHYWASTRLGELRAQRQWETSLFPRIAQELDWMDELAAAATAGTSLLAWSEQRQVPARFAGATTAGRPVEFDCAVHLPGGVAAKTHWPLIVFLHGYTAQPTISGAMREFPAAAAEGAFPFITVAPVLPYERERAGGWEPDEVIALLDTIERVYPVDVQRVYLTGFSMGGMGTWRTAMQYPGRFAAIAPVCGSGDPATLYRARNLPVWMFHGDRDTSVPLYSSVRMKTALERLGARPLLTVYTNVGHNAWTPAYRDPRLYAWMLEHSRDALPPPPPLRTPQLIRDDYALDALCVTNAPRLALLCAAGTNSLFDVLDSPDDTRKAVIRLYVAGQPYGIVEDVTIDAPVGCTTAALSAPLVIGIPVTSTNAPAGLSLQSLPAARCVSAVYTGPLSASSLADAESVLDAFATEQALTPTSQTRMHIRYFNWRDNRGTFVIQRICN